MIAEYFGLIEAAFVFGLALAFWYWQKRDLERENRKYAERMRREAASTGAAGHADREKGLDQGHGQPPA